VIPGGGQRRFRLQRVALELPPGILGQVLGAVQRGDVLLRIGLCAAAAVAMWAIIGGWVPPFPYRTGQTPSRDIVASVRFERPDPEKTEAMRERARSQVRYVYMQDPAPLVQLRSALKNRLAEISAAPSLDALPAGLWDEFSPSDASGAAPPTVDKRSEEFEEFRSALDTKEKLAAVEKAIDRAFTDLEQRGILVQLEQEHDQGNQTEIYVHPPGVTDFPLLVQVSEVRTAEATARLHQRLKEELGSPELAQRLFFWLRPKLASLSTLKKNPEATRQEIENAEQAVPTQFARYEPGQKIVSAGVPIGPQELDLLRLEYEAILAQRSVWQNLYRSLATFGMFIAMYTLCGFYAYYREPRLLADFRAFATTLALVVATVALAKMASGDAWRAELIPLLLFGMTLAIAYQQELALLLSAAVGLVVVIALGESLAEYITLAAGMATAVYLANPIRSRSKLIYVGLASGAVVLLTAIGVGILYNHPADFVLLREAARLGMWAVVAGFLMTGLLPFIEKVFDVLTDISLLEIGDVSHPLLQELVRRAPGTYNHSINVASIAEAAAESIGARGLLVRVGAYFHDKPHYFAENQPQGASRHESLMPAMSTLIIIAHIKDGADLARQHHLPQPIIDFILQHHGTTLVEYFFRRASEQSEAEGNGTSVDENSFRYPGPKPQSKEAAVLMLADAAESASRVLVEPTPARLESLVHDIAMKRLLDGQFDDSGLTLQELHTVEETLVKSLTAVYHSRVKYPDQKTA
jgi:putative nucleotidyltransferase with HDIG domain